MDDYAMIVQNRAIKDPSFLQINPFVNSIAALDPGSQVYWRPVAHLLIMSAFSVFGREPFGYHVLNLLLFYMACIGLYELLNFIFGGWELALLTSVLFCVHPINGVLVNYITATGYAVLVLAVIFSIRCFLTAGQETALWKKYGMYGLSLLWFALSLLCHETAFIGPFYLASVLFLIKGYSWRRMSAAMLPFSIVFMIYIAGREQFVHFKAGTLANMARFTMSLPEYGAAFSHSIFFYLKNLIFLEDIVLIWAVPTALGNLFFWNVASMVFLVVCLFTITRCRKEDPRSVGLAWFLIGWVPLSIASFSRPNLGFIIEPHWMLFSSTGFFLFIAASFRKFIQPAGISRFRSSMIGAAMICLLIVAYVFTSRFYNRLWGNEIAYCRYMIALSPNMRLPVWWLASAYLRGRDYEQARVLFRKTLTETFQDWEVYVNLGMIDSALGKRETALKNFYQAIAINPSAAEAYNNIGAEMIESDELDKAQEYLWQAVRLDRYFIEPKKNLAVLFLRQRKTKEAAELLEQVLRIKPDDINSLKTLRMLGH